MAVGAHFITSRNRVPKSCLLAELYFQVVHFSLCFDIYIYIYIYIYTFNIYSSRHSTACGDSKSIREIYIRTKAVRAKRLNVKRLYILHLWLLLYANNSTAES